MNDPIDHGAAPRFLDLWPSSLPLAASPGLNCSGLSCQFGNFIYPPPPVASLAGRGTKTNGFQWHKMTRLRRRFSDGFQASATTTADSSLSHSSPISLSEMMKGGAISTWSPRRPSIVPPIG